MQSQARGTKMKKSIEGVPALENYPYEWAWGIHPSDPMSIVIYHWSKPVMSLFLGEAMESAGYRAVMQHVEECNRTPWLIKWQTERGEELIELLKKDYNEDSATAI